MKTFVSCIVLLLLLWINYRYITRIYEAFHPNETQYGQLIDTQENLIVSGNRLN